MAELPKEYVPYFENDRRIFEENVRPRVTAELVEEHRRSPLGRNGDALKVVLRYLRRNRLALDGKEVVVCTVPHREWKIGFLSGVRGGSVRIDESRAFGSIGEAYHAIFLRRLRAHGLWSGE